MRSKLGAVWVSILSVAVLLITGIVGWSYWDFLSKGDTPTNVIRNVALIGGAVVAWIFAYWRSSIAEQQADVTRTQAELAKVEHYHSRFERASELLARPGRDNSLARISGFRAFRFLIYDHPELGPQAIETVASYMIQTPIDEHHDSREFIFARETATYMCDRVEQSGLFDEKEIFHLREDVRLAILLVVSKLEDAGIDPTETM